MWWIIIPVVVGIGGLMIASNAAEEEVRERKNTIRRKQRQKSCLDRENLALGRAKRTLLQENRILKKQLQGRGNIRSLKPGK